MKGNIGIIIVYSSGVLKQIVATEQTDSADDLVGESYGPRAGPEENHLSAGWA